MIPSDIPVTGWITPIVWFVRLLRVLNIERFLIFHLKDRAYVGVLSRIHMRAIHGIRDLTMSVANGCSEDILYEKIKSSADKFRYVMADILEVNPEEIHCTLKVFNSECDINNPEKSKVYTIARSSDETGYWGNRAMEYGITHHHLPGENSSFAALLGVKDRKNVWKAGQYNCFVENKLNIRNKYDSSGREWKDYYKATAVFPIRCSNVIDDDRSVICGFLTFDSKKSIFGSTNIFDIEDPKEYLLKIFSHSFYHVGGIMADSLAPVMVYLR